MDPSILGEILTSYEMSNALSNISKEDAEALSILSRLNKQSKQFYQELPLKSYLRQGKLETISELIERYKTSSSSKKQSIQKKIKQIISILDENEFEKLVQNTSETIPKHIPKTIPNTKLRFLTSNQLQKYIINKIENVADLDLPINIDTWSQLFGSIEWSIEYFKNNLPLVKYLSSQRKRLISNNQWNKKMDNTIIQRLHSGLDFTREKWALIIYTILNDELFEMLPKDISEKIYQYLGK